MNNENFQQFKQEVHDEIMSALRDSKLEEVFQKYGLVVDKLIKFDTSLDFSIIEPDDVVGDQQVIDFLRATPNEELVITSCWFCLPPGACCQC
ncbi:MAG: hypothetical protein HC862_22390 [Scytonema sp. RU_4_4]|nr:hypothetical protein [Scytonema sp. RU_4_4]NJR75811.1 hypothetical protein [Scytonema sp. CRU_2_7]